jgi:hypothetical protein
MTQSGVRSCAVASGVEARDMNPFRALDIDAARCELLYRAAADGSMALVASLSTGRPVHAAPHCCSSATRVPCSRGCMGKSGSSP